MDNVPRSPSIVSRIATTLAALLVVAVAPVVRADSAKAVEACPGAGTGRPCPYSSAQIIGQRAEGVLRFPEAVAIGPQGDVYVADQLGYVVQRFSPTGVFETEWGSYGGGHGQFGPIGGLATDAAGDVYVVDSSHARIQKFGPSGEFISTWGRPGSEVGRFSFGSSQDFTKPPGGGIAVSGNFVYVADSGNNRIERFNLQGGEAIAWGAKGSGPGQFSYPRGVAANAGEVLVSDDDNHRIEQFTPEGAYVNSVGTYGTGAGQFGFPYGVALDAANDVYVADDINHRVVKLTPQLTFAGAWGGFGSKPGQLAFPRALASDPAGDTYVADTANDRIEVFDPVGNYLRTIGISARSPGQLTAPGGLALDPTGRLLAADTVDRRIETYAAGSDVFASQWPAPSGRGFNAPSGIAVDPRGPVYISDTGNNRLTEFWGDGTYLAEIGGPGGLGGAQLSGASGLAVSTGNRQTYVADTAHNRILVYGPEGQLQGKWGAGEGNGAAGSQAGAFNHPYAVAIGQGYEVYVADTGNDRIVKLSPDGQVIGGWGGRGTGNGRFHAPTGIAADAAGDVFVLDSENNRVQMFDPEGHFLAKWGGRGIGLGQLSQPTAIAVGCEGSVYVADTNNNRVQRFNPVSPAPLPAGCLAAGTWPPPLDVAPVLTVQLLRSRGVLARRGLSMTVACQRGCRKVLVSATLKPTAHDRKAVTLEPVTRSLPALRAGHLRLRVSTTALARLRRELGSSRGLKAHVKIVAEGPTGRHTIAYRTYLVAR
jgi:tripartite motif-containing protein 71